jgi:hypothetical protein
MWDSSITRPIMTFDLGCAVGDIEWAPYSSTGKIKNTEILRILKLYL